MDDHLIHIALQVSKILKEFLLLYLIKNHLVILVERNFMMVVFSQQSQCFLPTSIFYFSFFSIKLKEFMAFFFCSHFLLEEFMLLIC